MTDISLANTVHLQLQTIFLFSCPHCQGTVEVARNEVNCAIFRHGCYKACGTQINPHMPKEECDRLFSQGLIEGCGKPFRLVPENSNYKIEECEYI